MSESGMWARVRPVILCLDPIRIESTVGLGISDVNYREGWIELKQVRNWPIKPSSPLRIPHFTQEQKIWIRDRAAAGRRTWVLLHIETPDEWMLFPGKLAILYLGVAQRDVLLKIAAATWRGTPTNTLVSVLTCP